VVQKAAEYFVTFLNSYTSKHRNICEKLQLGQIMWAAKLIPTKGGLFKYSKIKQINIITLNINF
jgi:hypothetical protein